MIRIVGLALLMLSATSVSLEGQRRDRGDSDGGPVAALIDLRSRIGLTDDQVSQLMAIDSSLRTRNEPLVTRLVEVRRAIRGLGRRNDRTPDEREQYDAFIEEARPLMKQIRENNNTAMRQIGGVLTDVQREQLGDILRERDDIGDRRGNSRGSRRN